LFSTKLYSYWMGLFIQSATEFS